MGKLKYRTITEVRALNPCPTFETIVQINNVPDDFSGTVLTCTYLGGVNIQQIVWLIVYCHPEDAIGVVGSLYDLDNLDGPRASEVLSTPIENLFASDSNEVKTAKMNRNNLRKINRFAHPRTEELNQEMLTLFKNIISEQQNRKGLASFLDVLRPALIKYDQGI